MDITYIDIIIFVIVFLLVLYYYGMKPYDHYKNTGVKYVRPIIPLVGNFENVLLGREHFIDLFMRIYHMYPDEKYIGMFENQKPQIMIKDLELIKKIGIKDFSHFHDHRIFIHDEEDLFKNMLFAMEGQKWKDMRASLSPAFTSSKMRNMFSFIENIAKNTADFLVEECDKKGDEVYEIEVTDMISRFANDVIANAVFGLEMNSLKDRDNEFYKLGRLSSLFSGFQIVKAFGFAFIPSVMKFLGISFTQSVVDRFFKTLVRDGMKNREKTGIVRHDMIHLLMEMKKGALVHETDGKDGDEAGFATVQESSLGKQKVKRQWNETELVGQAYVFFIAGFDTTSVLITFFFYEMIRNPEIQTKLLKEIDDFNKRSEGKITYNDVKELKYLDMTVSEILRMWPPIQDVDRVCTEPYTLPPPNDNTDKNYQIQRDESITIPVYALHHDPKYFPNPELFDPERFSDENKFSINPLSYLPFGIGPRNCIGSRFALLETKLMIYHILTRFRLVATEKTQIPIQLEKGTLTVQPKNGLYVGFKKRLN